MASLPAEVTYYPNTAEPQVLTYEYNENSFQIQLCREQSMGDKVGEKEEMQMALPFSQLPLILPKRGMKEIYTAEA